MFHIYCFSFPFGFSYLAFGTTVLFIVHRWVGRVELHKHVCDIILLCWNVMSCISLAFSSPTYMYCSMLCCTCYMSLLTPHAPRICEYCSMLFCWNAFEVPAMESGLITAITPRVGMHAIVAVGSSSSFHPGINQLPFNSTLQSSDPFSPTPAQQSAVGDGLVRESQSFSSSHYPNGSDIRIVEVGTTTDTVGLPSSSTPLISSGRETRRADLGNSTHDDNGNDDGNNATIRNEQASGGGGVVGVRPAVRPLGSPGRAPVVRIRTSESGSPDPPSPLSRGWPGGRGGGFPASSSEGSLLLRPLSDNHNLSHSQTSLLPPPMTSAPIAAHNFPASDFYNRQHHFDLSRRIQAEQVTAVVLHFTLCQQRIVAFHISSLLLYIMTDLATSPCPDFCSFLPCSVFPRVGTGASLLPTPCPITSWRGGTRPPWFIGIHHSTVLPHRS